MEQHLGTKYMPFLLHHCRCISESLKSKYYPPKSQCWSVKCSMHAIRHRRSTFRAQYRHSGRFCALQTSPKRLSRKCDAAESLPSFVPDVTWREAIASIHNTPGIRGRTAHPGISSCLPISSTAVSFYRNILGSCSQCGAPECMGTRLGTCTDVHGSARHWKQLTIFSRNLP